jgi:integrase
MKKINQLTPAFVKTAKPGRWGDGGNLYLEVSAGGGKSWVFMWKRDGKRRAMGLGSAHTISLVKARELAKQAAEAVASGSDPIEDRRQRRARTITFKEAASKCHADIGSNWRSGKYRRQWLGQLLAYTTRLAHRNVREITFHDVVGILRPLWSDQQDLALRVRERIEKVLDWSRVNGYRDEGAPNPALWKGNLKLQMGSLQPKRIRVQPMMALPYDDIPAFMERLRGMDDSLHRARALEFTVLTAARSNEAYGAQWDEIDFTKRLWTVSAARMKSGVPHVVPLSDRAMQILQDQYAIRSSSFVFPGARDERPMSNTAMLSVLQQLGVAVTVHGFRSTFRDWAGDLTRFPRDVIEHALAHSVGNATERSYRRGSALDRRRELMDAWAAYCERPPQADNIIQLERIKPIPA